MRRRDFIKGIGVAAEVRGPQPAVSGVADDPKTTLARGAPDWSQLATLSARILQASMLALGGAVLQKPHVI